MSKKKRMGKGGYTSKGIVGRPRRARTSVGFKRLINQQNAWLAGKRVMLVVDKAGHKLEAREVWGLPPSEKMKERNANS